MFKCDHPPPTIQSILFVDDDIDIAIIDVDGAYDRVVAGLANVLGADYTFSVRPWEGGDNPAPRRLL